MPTAYVGRRDLRAAINGDQTEDWSTAGSYGGADDRLVFAFHLDQENFGATPGYASIGNQLELKPSGSFATIDATGGHVHLPSATNTAKRGKYRVQIARTNVVSTDPNVANESVWSFVKLRTDEGFIHPNAPLLGLRIPASEQLNTNKPTITSLLEGRLCPVWDGASATKPTYNLRWTRNPAWVALDIILNRKYGLGDQFPGSAPLVLQWQSFADWCDELVYDNMGQRISSLSTQEGGSEWLGLQYDMSTADDAGNVRGSLTISVGSNPVPGHWEVGSFVGFSGLPTPNTHPLVMALDLNPEGFEIKEIQNLGDRRVVLWYDLDTSVVPWVGNSELNIALNPDSLEDYDIQVEGREPRFCFDAVFDREVGAWESLLTVLRSAPLERSRSATATASA